MENPIIIVITFNKIDDTGEYNLPATDLDPGKFVVFSLPDGSDVELEFVEDSVAAGNTPVPIVFTDFIQTDLNTSNNTANPCNSG